MNYDDFFAAPAPRPTVKPPTTEEGRWWNLVEPKYAAAGPFIVFNPAGKAPTYRHTTPDAAEKEAQRLAALHPGQEFFVMGAMSKTLLPKAQPTTTRIV
jgi:hypothetical protein